LPYIVCCRAFLGIRLSFIRITCPAHCRIPNIQSFQLVRLRNTSSFTGWGLLAPCQTPNLEDQVSEFISPGYRVTQDRHFLYPLMWALEGVWFVCIPDIICVCEQAQVPLKALLVFRPCCHYQLGVKLVSVCCCCRSSIGSP
jgi:hypothetical protein